MIKYIAAAILVITSFVSFAHGGGKHINKDKQAIIDIISSIKYGWEHHLERTFLIIKVLDI